MPDSILKLEHLDTGFYITFYTIIFVFGICIGSFLNVLICRLPNNESIVKSSSHCVKCRNKIQIRDLIPVISWILLKGRCRSCGEKISPRYPIVELMNAVIYIITFTVMDINAKSILTCLFFSTLIVIGFMDWDTLEIDLRLISFIFVLAGIVGFLSKDLNAIDRIVGGLIVSVPFFLIGEISAMIIEKNTGERIRGIELGDTFLMAVSGLFIGYKSIVISAFIGIIIAALAGMVIKKKSGESKFAFGPFLSMGLFIGTLWGEKLVDYWLSLFI